ncbi:MAG: galactokinase [Akkermansiaceae bacterium]|nr:galactokinase [Akkermansiaceae bacterium]
MKKLQDLASFVAAEFQKSYGRPPRWIAAAPGRVNVIGEHTDYNDGFVLPMAIEFYSVMAADRPVDGREVITLRSTLEPEVATIDLSRPVVPGVPKWGNYPRGVVAGFLARGIQPGGLEVLLHSTVPLGSGLSSSAALEVCTATLLEAVTGSTLDPVEKALLCQKAEHDFAGVPCGIMDQFISALGREGHLLLLDCRTRKTEIVPLQDPSVALLIINTNVKHELSGGEYAERRAQCEEAARNLGVKSLRDVNVEQLEKGKSKMRDLVYRRARHVIGEISRTVSAVGSVRQSDWPAVGRLMYASHVALRDDYEVSCPELDAVVKIAESIGEQGGVYGCRMTGGGFGGCCVALVKASSVDGITKKIASDYKVRTGITATIFSSRPAAGATVLRG